MKVTKCYCDICKKEMSEPEESTVFRIAHDRTVLMVDYNGIESLSLKPRTIDICRPCHEAIQEALDRERVL